MEWYYADAGQRVGPVNDAEFEALRVSGRIKDTTLVWRAGMPEWKPLNAIDTAAVAPPAVGVAAATYCTQCGGQYAAAELLTFGSARVCASCKDTFFQQVREQGVAAASSGMRYHYGGFWIRFLARLIDSLIFSVVFTPIFAVVLFAVSPKPQPGVTPDPAAYGAFFAVMLIGELLILVLFALYEGWFTSKRGGTPGKLVLGLRVIRPNGDLLTFGRAIGRFFGYMLSGLTLYIGYIIAAFDDEKRSLHDRICDTRVVYKK